MVKKIAYFRNPSKGVNYHRLELPLSKLTDTYEVYEVGYIDVTSNEFDVVIFNRFPMMYYPIGAIEKLKANGVKIVYDLDDYWTRPSYNPNYIESLESSYTTHILRYIRLADIVWCSTPELLSFVNTINKNSVLVPNALDYTEAMWTRQPIEREVTYGWVGGYGHHKDFESVVEYFRRPFRAQPVLCGAEKIDSQWQFLGNVITGGNYKRVKYVQSLEPYMYGVLYNELDIKILPSIYDTFTSCKSNLKLLEAGAHKLPVITNGGIYKKELNGRGVIAENPTTWHKALTRLIDSKDMREDYGEMLHEYTTKNYNLEKINNIRKQTIEL